MSQIPRATAFLIYTIIGCAMLYLVLYLLRADMPLDAFIVLHGVLLVMAGIFTITENRK